MMIETTQGVPLNGQLLKNYFSHLVNQFFKILPMREQEENTLPAYMDSLCSELLGTSGLIPELNGDPSLLTLISILRFLIDNPDCSVRKVKREVFRAISVCYKLSSKYTEAEADNDERMG